MNVDLAPARIDQHEAHRRSSRYERISQAVEQFDHPARVFELEHDVEVVVFARLVFEQRVNTPAAVQPDIDSIGL
jgi:hypothetical protein